MEIQGKYVKNMRKYKGTIIVLIVCMIFAYLYAHVDKKEYFYSKRLVFGYLDIRRFLTHNDRR